MLRRTSYQWQNCDNLPVRGDCFVTPSSFLAMTAFIGSFKGLGRAGGSPPALPNPLLIKMAKMSLRGTPEWSFSLILNPWVPKQSTLIYGLSMIVILTLCPNFWVISRNDRSDEAILPIKIKYDIIFLPLLKYETKLYFNYF